MVADLPPSAEASPAIDIEYRTGDPDLHARSSRLRAKRHEPERDAADVASHTRELAEQLSGRLPVSDTAILLSVTKGRVTPLKAHHSRAPRRALAELEPASDQ